MTYTRDRPGRPSFGPPPGSAPQDIWWLLIVLFVTFSMQFFGLTGALVQQLRLSLSFPGMLWQPLTYAFIGNASAGLFILLILWILYMFSVTIRGDLGRKRFWQLLIESSVIAAVGALIVGFLSALAFGPNPATFSLMQGDRVLMSIVIAAFAILHRHATIMLFFVIPMQASYFIPLEILIAFIGFLGNKDFAGFIGICLAIGWVWFRLNGGFRRRGGRGGSGGLKELRLKLTRWYMQKKLESMRRKRGFKIVPGGKKDDRKSGGTPPWVN